MGAPGGPGGAPGGPNTGTGIGGPDLTEWAFWWEFNKEPYLNLKRRVHADLAGSRSDGFFLGFGEKNQHKDTYKPTDEQIRKEVVPALLAALAKETNNDIVTGCLIALAKIGDGPSETGDSPFAGVISRFLADRNQEISETAAVALGILANPESIDRLSALLQDSPAGRNLVGRTEVGFRTRAFAAYGLGLIGSSAAREEDRRKIVSILHRTLEDDSTRNRDIEVSCVIAMGLVALDTIDSPARPEKGAVVSPESSRAAQLEYLLAFLANDRQGYLVRAHCPTALARLLVGMPSDAYETYRTRIAEELLARIGPRSKEPAEVVQSSVQALGLIGTNDNASPLDRKIREALATVSRDVSSRNFATIALAKIGARTANGARDAEGGIDEIASTLLARLADGKGGLKSWAGLACGVLGYELEASGNHSSHLAELQRAVRSSIEDEGKNPARLGAFAIAVGLMGDVETGANLRKRLQTEKDETALGYVALGLGLMNDRDAVDQINRVVDESRYRPDLLKQTSIALGLLGDKDVVPKLIALLQEAKGIATQASISKALGVIGDKRSIAPLVEMLRNDDLTDGARAFAAAALGIVADKEDLPWNSRIAQDLNYLAATETLTNADSGTGILDIL